MTISSRRPWKVLLVGVTLTASCSRSEQAQRPEERAPAVTVAPAAAPALPTAAPAAPEAVPEPDGILTHLEGRSGDPEGLWAEASYKVKREGGKLSKTLKVSIDSAPPGLTHALQLDGFAIGKLITKMKGEGDFELVEAGGDYFPDGFQEPKNGSVIRIGELADLRLESLEKLADLRTDIAGPGKLAGKVDFKIERLGSAVTREFEVKVTNAEVKTVHAIRLDGVHIADLNVDLAGKGKLEFSTLRGLPFPHEFQEPRAGSTIEIEGLFKGELHDNLKGHVH